MIRRVGRVRRQEGRGGEEIATANHHTNRPGLEISNECLCQENEPRHHSSPDPTVLLLGLESLSLLFFLFRTPSFFFYLRVLDEGPEVRSNLGVLGACREGLKNGSLQRRANATPHQLDASHIT